MPNVGSTRFFRKDKLLTCDRLDALLHLAVIHRGSFQDGKSLASNQASILWTLRSFLVHPKLQQQPDHLVYAFDVAALFTDGMSFESRRPKRRALTRNRSHGHCPYATRQALVVETTAHPDD